MLKLFKKLPGVVVPVINPIAQKAKSGGLTEV